jgi:hypothetical protein
MKKIVKISNPISWDKHGHWSFAHHTKSGNWGDFVFNINQNLQECDYWIIYGDIDETETVFCPPENVFFITSEEKTQIIAYPPKFLKQFSKILTSRDDIVHPDVTRMHYICPWHVKKSYQELSEMHTPLKKETLSAIISTSTYLEGHKKRFAFINKLKGHFKDKLAWFAKGENYIEDKWDGLHAYKYSIAIENSSHLHYFTEKITDVYLAYTMPIYWGCPNITDYFPSSSLIQIDVEDYKASIIQIEKAIDENMYEKNIEHIKEARNLVLNQLQPIPSIVQFLENSPISQASKIKKTVYPIKKFTKDNILRKVFNKLKMSNL